MTTLPDLEPAEMTDAEIERWAEVCNYDLARKALRHYIALRRAARSAAPEAGKAVTLRQLQAAHIERQAEWCPDQAPDLSFRGNEMAGEVGEACNVIKKLERERQGWRGSRATKEQLAEELGDVIHTAILCAITAGIDIEPATVAKFNSTSEKNGLSTFISALASVPAPSGATAMECASADCGKPATRYYSKFGVGSHHCEECYQRIVDLASSPQAVPAEDVASLVAATEAELAAGSLSAMDWNTRSIALVRKLLAALTSLSAERDALAKGIESWQEDCSRYAGEMSAISAAIGSVRFMDPPDGGSVTLAEQVARMRQALTASEAEATSLRRKLEEAVRVKDDAIDNMHITGARAEAAERKLEEHRKALEPFGAIPHDYDDDFLGSRTALSDTDEFSVKVRRAWLRRARALSEREGQDG